MEYKLVVLDLDGTLLQENKEISKRTIEYLSELKKNDIDVVIATGRSYYHGKKLIEPLKEDMIILSNNGSIARHTSNDEVIFASYLSEKKSENIIKESIRQGFNPILHVNEFNTGYDLVIEKDPYDSSYHGYMTKDNIRFKKIKLSELKYDKILSVCLTGEFNELETFRKNVINKYPNTYNSFTSRNLKIRALLEFLDLRGCKWEGIKRYAKSKNINREEIISIGDDNNDIELIKKSGLGIAMKNGTTEIKNIADKITRYDNNSDGVVQELQKYFNIRTEK